MTINKEIVKEKWEKTKKFVKDHPLQIAAGVGAAAGLYLGYKFGFGAGAHSRDIANSEALVKAIPEFMRVYGQEGANATASWVKDHVPEADNLIMDYVENHSGDEGFVSVSNVFWNRDNIKNTIDEVNKVCKASHLKVRLGEK